MTRSAARKREIKETLGQMPWIRYDPKGTDRCEGIKWGAMSFKRLAELRESGEIPEQARCKRRAIFVLRNVMKPRKWEIGAAAGRYCWQHLSIQMYDHEPERRRTNRWMEKNAPEYVTRWVDEPSDRPDFGDPDSDPFIEQRGEVRE